MKILSLECSASPASVCVTENGRILSSSFINVKMTHSQTLLPMVKNSLDAAGIKLDDIDAFAISSGPGSFTGIRIGIAAVKGLAFKDDVPCVAVSTLEAMAQLFINENALICAVMDARCNQVYNALFKVENGQISRLCDDRALLCQELKEELEKNYSNEKIIITGDGADLFYSYVLENNNISLAPEHLKYQNAIGVAFAAETAIQKDGTLSPAALLPKYLRLPQAERELKKKLNKQECC